MRMFYTPMDVRKIIPISYSQLCSWDRRKICSPSYRRRGKYRLYTFHDAVQLDIGTIILRKGGSIYKVRRMLDAFRNSILPQITKPLAELDFLIDNEEIVACSNIDTMTKGMEGRTYCIQPAELVERINEAFPSPSDRYANPIAT